MRDLGSSNGTFVNGERIDEAPLEPGDVLRFGVVELTFTGPGGELPARPAARPGGGEAKWILLGALGLALLVAAVAAIVRTGPPPEPSISKPPISDDQQALKLLGKCQAYADHESPEYDLERCLAVCSQAHALDETRGANRIARRCQRERDNEALLEQASKLIGTGLEEEGLKVLLPVDRDAAVFPKAKAKFDEAVEILVKKNKSLCKGDVHGGFFETAWAESCRRVLELTCNRPEGPDSEALRWFQHAARQVGRGKGEFKCPAGDWSKYQNPIGPKVVDPREAAEAAIRARYPNPKVAELMVGYFRDGSAKKASGALKNLRSQSTPRERSQFTELILWLDLIDGKVTTGAGRIAFKQVKEAEAVLKEAFDAEARILPPGIESEIIGNTKADLAKLHADLAKDACAKDHLEKCFVEADRGSQLNPRDTNLLGMLRRMETAANERLNQDRSCESVAYALAITRPGTPVNDKALELGKELGCPAPKKTRP